MQIDFNQLSIDKIFMLSKHIKEKCKNLSSFEEVAQELMMIFYSSFVAEDGRSPFVLARFFKTCAYGELPDDIKNYIHNKDSKWNLISDDKYLTLLGSFGELDNWKNRNLSENYKAFPIHDEHMLDKFPMLSATFEEIGLKLSHLKQTDKSILIKDSHRQYGVFCVEDAEGSKLIPKQAEFVRPYSVKSVFGFGGIYSTSNVYAVIVFARERLSRKDAELFLRLNPAIKQITLAHEIAGSIFITDRKDANASVNGICDEIPKEMALTSSVELEMSNEYLLQISEVLREKNKMLVKEIEDREQSERHLHAQHAVIQILVESITLEEASPKILQAICEALEWDLGEIWKIDQQRNVLTNTEVWHVSALKVPEFNAATKQITFFQKVGFPGRIWERAEPLWIEDVCHDTNFLRASVASKEGLHGAFGFPIIMGSEVLGIICFYSHEIMKPDKKLLKMMAAIGSQIGLFIKRKQAEGRLRKLSHAIDQSSSTIVVTDTKGNIEYTNPRFTQLTGYSTEEVIGKNPRFLKSGETLPEVYEELWSTIKSGNEWNGEFCNKKKNGELYWEHTSISPVKDDKGVIVNFIAVKDDITERKEMDRKLHTSEENYRTLVSSVKDYAIFRITPEGIISSWNEGVKAIKGYEADEVIGNHISIFYPEEDVKAGKVERGLQKAKENGEYEDEGWRVKKDGSRFWANVVIAAIHNENGKLVGYTKVARDFTDRKKAEKALLQSEKLKSIGTITAGISHEFNNLLAIISGNVQLLEGAYKDDKALANALRTIMKATDDGAEISRNMLKFTKAKPDINELVSSDINDMIMQSLDFAKPRWKNEAQAKGIDYKIDTEGMKSVPSIMCKHAEIREIFINIINNALDAMPGGGSMTFSTWSGDDSVFVRITDNGEGMSEDVKKSVFDPFFSTKGVNGTGLGMSMTYGIVSRHGGTIDVDSEIGKGTTFTLQFPTANKRASLIEVPEPEQETNVKSLRVLVIDDEDAIRDILNQFLSRSGHEVKTVGNGADAINMIEGEEFDLVLCDLAMPDVFGYDVVKVLNGLKKRPKIGIVTGWDKEFENAGGKELNVDFYLKKPFKHSELAKHISEAFDTNGG